MNQQLTKIHELFHPKDEGIEEHLPELIGGIVAGFVVITLLILIFVCALRKKGDKQQQQQQPTTVVAVEAEERAPSPKKEQGRNSIEKISV